MGILCSVKDIKLFNINVGLSRLSEKIIRHPGLELGTFIFGARTWRGGWRVLAAFGAGCGTVWHQQNLGSSCWTENWQARSSQQGRTVCEGLCVTPFFGVTLWGDGAEDYQNLPGRGKIRQLWWCSKTQHWLPGKKCCPALPLKYWFSHWSWDFHAGFC